LTPVSVYGNRTFCKISAGSVHTLAIDKNGKAWGWGINSSGELGNGSFSSCIITPVSVYGNKTFCKIVAGGSFSIAIDKNGKGWGWGYSYSGQAGYGYGQDASPMAILGNKTFCEISSMGYNSVAIDKNGKLWAWGESPVNVGTNESGEYPEFIASPMAVCSDKTFCKISHGQYAIFATDKNGDTWAWGQYGAATRLGLVAGSSILNKKFNKIFSYAYTTIGLDTQGKVWTWGSYLQGRLGQNTPDPSRPVRIDSF
jgi:alpha-tubulin suppressor-like RCC1 family protein